MLKDLEKMVKPHHIVILIGIVVIGFALMQYSEKKDLLTQGYTGGQPSASVKNVKPALSASAPMGAMASTGGEQVASVSGMTGPNVVAPPNCNSQPTLNPSDLLPNDSNSEWAKMNPGALSHNFLNASSQIKSIDTVGASLRNANLQVRSEPPNPQTSVSPWLNTTIEPDLMRQPLEIGCGCPGASPQ